MPEDSTSEFERELKLREREIAIKKRWTNLFIAALVIAAFPAAANVYVTLRNGAAQQQFLEAQTLRLLQGNKNLPLTARVDLAGRWIDDSGKYIFPSKDLGYEDGCLKPAHPMTLQPPNKIDRYGSPRGNYLSPPQISYEARALPYDKAKMPHYTYEVLKALTVQECTAVPWFDQAGGGVQYKVAEPVQQLVDEGYLKDVSDQ